MVFFYSKLLLNHQNFAEIDLMYLRAKKFHMQTVFSAEMARGDFLSKGDFSRGYKGVSVPLDDTYGTTQLCPSDHDFLSELLYVSISQYYQKYCYIRVDDYQSSIIA